MVGAKPKRHCHGGGLREGGTGPFSGIAPSCLLSPLYHLFTYSRLYLVVDARRGEFLIDFRWGGLSEMVRVPTDGEALTQYASIPRVAGGSREGDRVAHIGEAGDVGEGALEAEAEAGLRHRAVAAQIAVPGVVLAVDAALGHAAVQHLEPLLAWAAADDLADPRRQHVHCRNRPAVVVHPHVKRLDALRVVHHDDRF